MLFKLVKSVMNLIYFDAGKTDGKRSGNLWERINDVNSWYGCFGGHGRGNSSG